MPDDLAAATMRPKADLRPGDAVVAVGFPFGIGPSVSAGVVSGLKRQFRTTAGDQLSNLIQFDAAVNPGSSGGPLLNAAGEVVGIVTAMLDPGGGGFAGIGFAVPIETARRRGRNGRPSDMTFLSPEFLWLLLALPAIVAVYLLVLKRKKQARCATPTSSW